MHSEEKFELFDSHEFYVTIKQGGFSFSGVLNLTPEKITIKFGGDSRSDRYYEYPGEKVDSLECSNTSHRFILFGLHNIGFHAHFLPENPVPIRHFDLAYEVGSVIVCPMSLQAIDVSKVEIHSSTFNDWLGLTTTQDNILSEYQRQSGDESDQEDDDDPGAFSISDFFCTVEEFGNVFQRYNVREFRSLLDYGAGVSFPPSLRIDANESINPAELMGLYSKVYDFFSVLHGDELLVERIELRSAKGFSWEVGYLYYPVLKERVKFSRRYSLFPLGRNLKFNTQGLPALPEGTFESYFRLESKRQKVWGKYIKYRRMKNVEERFLGYFRLLEMLTYKSSNYLDSVKLEKLSIKVQPFFIRFFGDRKSVKSFFERLPGFNGSKYNTEKCMVDFYKSLPAAAKEKLKLNQSNIGSICKLRNDISHANDYYISDEELWGKCVFVESLLVFAMFQSVGVPLPDVGKVIDRLH
ncbi:hypothetical protein G9Q84_27015 [Pseudomonas sp. P7]|uniref:HEPN domain-containing protein n=1 Tax=Pseudomonas sivasensis TaxID=1880678 RepID=UPI0015EBBD14|nr:HEPN domain-containing protein [Pseudomonas sivasensis]MBA2926529.1 hypothetical protein [Pseudomonas sivasensis]